MMMMDGTVGGRPTVSNATYSSGVSTDNDTDESHIVINVIRGVTIFYVVLFLCTSVCMLRESVIRNDSVPKIVTNFLNRNQQFGNFKP